MTRQEFLKKIEAISTDLWLLSGSTDKLGIPEREKKIVTSTLSNAFDLLDNLYEYLG